MFHDNYFTADTALERKRALAKTLRPISLEELKKLGEEVFPPVEHEWRDAFFRFLDENADATFHQASTHDGIHLVYCIDKDKGMWYVANGFGPLQVKGRTIMKELIQAQKSGH